MVQVKKKHFKQNGRDLGLVHNIYRKSMKTRFEVKRISSVMLPPY